MILFSISVPLSLVFEFKILLTSLSTLFHIDPSRPDIRPLVGIRLEKLVFQKKSLKATLSMSFIDRTVLHDEST